MWVAGYLVGGQYLRQSGVGQVHQLKHAADELAVHGVVLIASVDRGATADGRAYYVHQPCQLAWKGRIQLENIDGYVYYGFASDLNLGVSISCEMVVTGYAYFGTKCLCFNCVSEKLRKIQDF